MKRVKHVGMLHRLAGKAKVVSYGDELVSMLMKGRCFEVLIFIRMDVSNPFLKESTM